MYDNMKNLENFLRESEKLYEDAIEEFKNSVPEDRASQYKNTLNFVTHRGKGIVFNFDYYFFVKFESGIDYIGFILENYSALKQDFNFRSDIFLSAVLKLEKIHCHLINNLGRWYEDDGDEFSSKYYIDQISILSKYKDDVLEREINAAIMEEKLSKVKHNIKNELNRLFLDLAIIEHEISICNEILYSVFDF